MSKAAQQVQVLLENGDLKAAMIAVNTGLNRDPEDMALVMMASCIVSREQCWGMAYNLLKHVKENSPPFPEILNNLGMAASSLASSSGEDKYLHESEKWLRQALEKNRVVETLSNLALVLLHMNRLSESEELCREILALDSGNVSGRETLGYIHLFRHEWAEGFGNYEFTLGNKYRKLPKMAPRYWERGDRNLDLFVRGEQGLGDEINYAQVLKDAAKDNRITYECDHRLAGLIGRSVPGIEVHGTRFVDDPPWKSGREFDAHTLSGSLFMQYRREGQFVGGWMKADPERCLQWKALLETLPGRKVGIAWTGGVDNTFKHRRSFSLDTLLPLLRIPGITWVSLQYKDVQEELDAFYAKTGIEIRHWKRAVEKGVDYDDTAALVSELDCVVTVPTAIACLAGALGKRCHVLVPKWCQWFYASDTEKHAWYNSLTLYRQKDSWDEVIERVRTGIAQSDFLRN